MKEAKTYFRKPVLSVEDRLRKIEKLKKLYLWWINYDNGRLLRGTGELEKIEKYLFKN